MADFTNNVQPVQSPISPQGGVVDNSTANALGSASNVLSGIGEGLFGSRAVATRKAIEKGHENSFVASYEQQQLKLANAVDQGGMSSDEARMRMRANYYNALSNWHGDPEDLAAAHARVVNTTGLGKIIETGTKQEQMRQTLVTDAAKAGWVKPTMSQDEQDTALAHYQQFQMQTQLLQSQQAAIGYQRAQVGLQADKVQLGTARISQQAAGVNLQSARLGLVEAQEKRQSQVSLGGLQDTYNYKFQGDLNDIKTRFDNHEIDDKQATLEIQQQLATVTQSVGTIGASAGGDYINNLMTPMKMRADTMLKYVSGDLDRKLLDNKLYKIEALQKANMLGDPQIAQLTAASSLLPNAPFAIQREMGDQMMKILKKNGSNGSPANVVTDDPDEQPAVKDYFDTLKTGMSQSIAGLNDNPESTDSEINQNLVQTLKSIKAYGTDADPKKLKELTSFLASPEFGQYYSKRGGIPAGAVSDARQVLDNQFENVAIPLIQKKYEETIKPFAKEINGDPVLSMLTVRPDSTGNVIHPTFNGSGVSFIADNLSDIDAIKKAKELNNSVSPVLNQLVRMRAHLDGNTDYKKAYEDNYAKYFEPEKTNENGD